MDVEFLELTETTARFVVSGLTPTQVNAIRRKMVHAVPKMAIDQIDFHHGPTQEGKESISAYFDEIVAHRLGLVPIPTDLGLFNFMDDCACEGEGCPSCTITYAINKSGPATVYSADLEPVGSDFRVKEGLIPITRLTEDQAILIYAKARLGTGRQHAKWQSVVAAGHKYAVTIDVNSKLCNGCKACIEACPKKVMSMKGKVAFLETPVDCTACKSCLEACTKDAITLEMDPDTLVFQFETDGALFAKDALQKAIEILTDDYDELGDQIAEL